MPAKDKTTEIESANGSMVNSSEAPTPPVTSAGAFSTEAGVAGSKPPSGLTDDTKSPLGSSSSASMSGLDANEKGKAVPEETSKTPVTPPSASGDVPSTPSPSQEPSKATVTTRGGGGSKLNLVLIILGILALLTIGAVGYLYFTNQNLAMEQESQQLSPTPTSTPTPIPEDSYEIINGSVYRVTPGSDEVLLVDKADFEETGIAGFVEVSVSPDETKLCFISLPPSLDPALYISDIDGENVISVSDGKKDCTWASTSDKIAYIDDSAIDRSSDVYIYNLDDEEEVNYTEDSQPVSTTLIRRYEIGTWDDAGQILECIYQEINLTTEESSDGNCQINTLTGEFTDLSATSDTEEEISTESGTIINPSTSV